MHSPQALPSVPLFIRSLRSPPAAPSPRVPGAAGLQELRRSFLTACDDVFVQKHLVEGDARLFSGLWNQTEITACKRFILFDHLSENSPMLKLTRETVHLAYSLVDRFLESTPCVPLSQFQMIGVTALFIARKLDNRKIDHRKRPEWHEFLSIMDPMPALEKLRETELSICIAADWNLLSVTSLDSLRYLCSGCPDLFLKSVDLLERVIKDEKSYAYSKLDLSLCVHQLVLTGHCCVPWIELLYRTDYPSPTMPDNIEAALKYQQWNPGHIEHLIYMLNVEKKSRKRPYSFESPEVCDGGRRRKYCLNLSPDDAINTSTSSSSVISVDSDSVTFYGAVLPVSVHTYSSGLSLTSDIITSPHCADSSSTSPSSPLSTTFDEENVEDDDEDEMVVFASSERARQ